MSINEERTKNILEVYEYLLQNKLIEDKADFCNQIGLNILQFDWIQAGKIFFPVNNLLQLTKIFHVNVNFIYHGRGSMFSDK